jgi:TPR repeat protein
MFSCLSTNSGDSHISIPFTKEEFNKIYYYHDTLLHGFSENIHAYLGCVSSFPQKYVGLEYDIAHTYATGELVERNADIALEYYQKALTKGDVRAMVGLGDMYEKGFGVKKDRTESIRLYESAANGGNIDAKAKLVRIYREDIYGKTKLDTVIKFYEDLIKCEHVESIREYSKLMYNGDFVTKNQTYAIELLTDLATKKDDVESMYLLGIIELLKHYNSSETIDLKWLEEATKRKHVHAMRRLALHIGCSDHERAIKLFNECIELGDNCWYSYGRLMGDLENYNEANRLYRVGIENGDTSSLIGLGVNYFNGNGFENNIDKAIELFNIALQKGNWDALSWLTAIYAKYRKDDNKLLELLEFGVNQKDIGSMLSLIDIYNDGVIVQKDETKAKQLKDVCDKLINADIDNDLRL